MEKRFYIAYGSNLNIEQMKVRCPNAKVIGTAVIKDYQLLFKGSKTGSYLTIEPHKGSSVPAAVWEISRSDEKSLDRYEGYPNFYYKKEMFINISEIISEKIRKRKAFAYIMHEERKLGVPSPYYVKTCISGYMTFGFDKAHIFDAIEISRRNAYENE